MGVQTRENIDAFCIHVYSDTSPTLIYTLTVNVYVLIAPKICPCCIRQLMRDCKHFFTIVLIQDTVYLATVETQKRRDFFNGMSVKVKIES